MLAHGLVWYPCTPTVLRCGAAEQISLVAGFTGFLSRSLFEETDPDV